LLTGHKVRGFIDPKTSQLLRPYVCLQNVFVDNRLKLANIFQVYAKLEQIWVGKANVKIQDRKLILHRLVVLWNHRRRVTKNSDSKYTTKGEFHDQADTKWIVIKGPLRGYDNTPAGGQPPAGLLASWGLAALRAYMVFLVLSY
jgi:hypothetical protein